MFRINNSNISLFGNSVTYYAIMPIIAACVITAIGCLFAYLKKLDMSYMFRVCLITYLCGAIGFLYVQKLPGWLIPFAFPLGNIGVVLCFVLSARMFRKTIIPVSAFGAFSYLILSMFTTVGCLLTGCCYGKEFDGFPSILYGIQTMNPHPGIPLFASQFVEVCCYAAVAVPAFFLILKRDSVYAAPALISTNLFLYYAATFLCDKSANTRMWIGNINIANIMSVLTVISLIYWWIRFCGFDRCLFRINNARRK